MKRSFHWTGLCALLPLYLAAGVALPAQHFKNLGHFDGKNGARPFAPLVQAIDGNLYGTTSGLKAKKQASLIFKVSPIGAVATVDLAPGGPYGGLLQATDGNLYGTTSLGGIAQGGTFFKLTPQGNSTTLYDFCGGKRPRGCAFNPLASLVEGTGGNFYGTASEGGTHVRYSPGTVFMMTPAGALTTLHDFCAQRDCADGYNPDAPLVQGRDGSLYGTANSGGSSANGPTQCSSGGCGTIFKVAPSGHFKVVHTFCAEPGCADGYLPYGGLIQATDGAFYGTTTTTIFKLTSGGTFTTLYTFCSQSNCADGASSMAGLAQATDGNFYGTTFGGGATYGGTIFRITPAGVYTVLHNFCAKAKECSDGGFPMAPLIQCTDGSLYGTAYGTNDPNVGTVFKLSVGLRPFVTTLPTSGAVGAPVTILGNDLTGVTAVTFAGVPVSSFTVNSTGSAITATVPAGATSGNVRVTLPSHTLKSNVPFRVTS